MKNEEQELHDRARKVSREKVVEALEGVGIACYESESTDELREALVANILDGTLTEDALDGY